MANLERIKLMAFVSLSGWLSDCLSVAFSCRHYISKILWRIFRTLAQMFSSLWQCAKVMSKSFWSRSHNLNSLSALKSEVRSCFKILISNTVLVELVRLRYVMVSCIATQILQYRGRKYNCQYQILDLHVLPSVTTSFEIKRELK